MEIQDLTDFISKENDRLFSNYFPGYDKEKRILHAAVKANEELGELCDATLKYLGAQRQNKMHDFKKDDVASEIADSIFAVSILAHLMDINLDEALQSKMDKINARYNESGREIINEL